jgi:hypothetical protein
MSLAYKSLQNDNKMSPKPTFAKKVFSSLKSASCASKILAGPEPQSKRITGTKFSDESASEIQIFIKDFLDQRSGHLDKILTFMTDADPDTVQNACIFTLLSGQTTKN